MNNAYEVVPAAWAEEEEHARRQTFSVGLFVFGMGAGMACLVVFGWVVLQLLPHAR